MKFLASFFTLAVLALTSFAGHKGLPLASDRPKDKQCCDMPTMNASGAGYRWKMCSDPRQVGLWLFGKQVGNLWYGSGYYALRDDGTWEEDPCALPDGCPRPPAQRQMEMPQAPVFAPTFEPVFQPSSFGGGFRGRLRGGRSGGGCGPSG